MTITILTAVWRRPEILRTFLKNVIDLSEITNIKCVCVCSEDGEAEICRQSGMRVVMCDNEPLGKKWNTGLKFIANNISTDYVMIMGSDDVMNAGLLNAMIRSANKGYDLIGIEDCYFFDSDNNQMYYYKGEGQLIGMCRMVRTYLLESLNWKLWQDQQPRGLDAVSNARLCSEARKIKAITVTNTNRLAIDIKSKDSLSSITLYEHALKRVEITDGMKQLLGYKIK